MFKNRVGFWGSAPDPAGGPYDAPPDPLVVRGFLPSAIAVSRLRRLIPLSPPKQKIPAPLAPQTKILEPPLYICMCMYIRAGKNLSFFNILRFLGFLGFNVCTGARGTLDKRIRSRGMPRPTRRLTDSCTASQNNSNSN